MELFKIYTATIDIDGELDTFNFRVLDETDKNVYVVLHPENHENVHMTETQLHDYDWSEDEDLEEDVVCWNKIDGKLLTCLDYEVTIRN